MIQGEEESGDEDEDWKHPGEIVGALAAFNREVDHSEAYDSVVQSQAESTLLSPSFGSRGLIDFGWKDRPRWVYFFNWSVTCLRYLFRITVMQCYKALLK